MNKMLKIVFIIVFLGLCTLPLAGWIFGYENQSAEKRALAELPKVVDENGLNTEVTQQFDDYYTDNFAFRSDLITAHAHLYGAVLRESVQDQVILGSGGWLYFEPTLNDHMRRDVLPDEEIGAIAAALKETQTMLEARGISFVFTVAPNKASIYPEYMPERYLVQDGQSNAQKLHAALDAQGVNHVDLHTALDEHSKMLLYHKLDTHWNGTGATIAYHALMENIAYDNAGFAYQTYNIGDFTVEKTWGGDLSGMLYPSAAMKDEQHVYDVAEEFKTARPLRSLEAMRIDATCDTGSLNAVMYRDSFANALIPILSNEFASVTYTRATPYDFSLVTDDTDVVIIEIVERNIPELLAALTGP